MHREWRNVCAASAGKRSQHASRHVRDAREACRGPLPAVFFEVGGWENVPTFPVHAQPAIFSIW